MTKRKALSTVVAESLSESIRSGRLPLGARLPTEAELCAEYDVSRTVVREAVARLRSAGLVIPQQGRGMFVSDLPIPRNFSIPDQAMKTLPETLALLELRLGVEVEAAALCAERRTDEQLEEIRTLMERFDARHEYPASIQVHYDYDFHLAIAKATGNGFIHGFLAYLRPLIGSYRLGYVVAPEFNEKYYARIHDEHRSVVDAIAKRDAAGARRAMRTHLSNSLQRLRALAPDSGAA